MTTPNPGARSASDRAAFEKLYVEMAPKVYRYCTARLGIADGEDAMAETFHAAVAAFNSGRVDELTPGWLIGVARHKVIDRGRALEKRRSVAHLFLVDESRGLAPGFETADPRREWVEATLEKIKPRHRMLLVMHYVEGMPAELIADTLDASRSSIESALARARRSFRRTYSELAA